MPTRKNSRSRVLPWSLLLLLPLLLFAGTVWTDNGPLHQVEQSRPIFLGSSGGNINDISSRYCCGGTLGCLVQDVSGYLYILSNNHVLAKSNLGAAGEAIIHPGLIDQDLSDNDRICTQDLDDTVAILADFLPLKFRKGLGPNAPTNVADAAIAMIDYQAVRNDGAILDIGALSANTVGAVVGQAVQKSGRTTGHTLGQVAAVDVTVDVGYSTECGGNANQVARFVNQIRITPGGFSAGGDSGSAVVEADGTDPGDGRPRALGLLFAGSSSSTLANPIDPVLAALNVSMVGGSVAPPPTSTPTPTPTPTPDPGDGGQAIVQCITFTTDGGRGADKHLNVAVLVLDDSGSPVSGAAVGIELWLDGALYGSGTATTSLAGQASFSVKNAPNGAYSVVVTNVASSLSFEGTTPENLFRKGIDASPDADCRGDAPQPSEGTAPRRGWQLEAAMHHASQVKARHEERLFGLPGVVGTGLGRDAQGKPVVEIYLDQDRPATRAQTPARLEDVPTRVIVTGPFVAY